MISPNNHADKKHSSRVRRPFIDTRPGAWEHTGVAVKKIPLILLSLVLSVFLLYVLFTRVRPADFIDVLTSVYLPALLVYMTVNLAATFLRAWRYRVLLHPIPISWGDILIVTLVRNSFDDLLPARVGSLSYIYVLTERLEKPFEHAAASFVIAFVFDFLTLAPFLIAAVLLVGLGTSGIPSGAFLAAAAFFLTLFAVLAWKIAEAASFFRRAATALIAKTRWPGRPAVLRSFEKWDRTVAILRQTRPRGDYPRVLLASLFIRLGKYLSLFALLYAVLRSRGVSFPELDFWKTVLGLTGAELTSALPLKGLAGFGTWESAWAAALQLMRFDPGLAILSGLGIHLITNLFEYGLGLAGLAVLAFRRKRDRISGLP
jgi:hypothetical protein